MEPITISFGFLMITAGGALVYYLSLRHGRFETVFNGLGVALIACGIAVVRDGASATRDILWMLPPAHSLHTTDSSLLTH